LKVASSLIDKGLVREIRAKAGAPVWHENDDGRFALKITTAGREAIGVDGEDAGGAALASSPAVSGKTKKRESKPPAKKDAKASAAQNKPSRRKASGDAASTPSQIRAGSKQAKIIELMKRPKGATLDELIKAADWLPHTTRAALTGLRKRGFTLERVRDEAKGSVYRVKSGPTAAAA
jgi:hypothetical protein